MATITTNMSLTKWGSPTDKFDYQELASNFDKIDSHNHASGNGVQIPRTGIVPGAVDASLIAPSAVGNVQIAPNAITSDKIVDGQVDTSELAPNAVTYAKLNNNAKILIGTDATDSITASATPSNVTTGQLIAIPNATGTGLWTFRWSGQAFSSNTGGWDFVGGSPASAYNESLSGIANNTNNYTENNYKNYKSVYSDTSTTFGINLTYKGIYDIRGGIEYVADGSNTAKCYTGGLTGYGTGLSTYYVTNILRSVTQYVTYGSATSDNICGFTSAFNGVHLINAISQTVRLWHRPIQGDGSYNGTDLTKVSSASLQIVPIKIYV